MTDIKPRAFMLDPTGHFLYSAGLIGGTMSCFRIDQDKGTLSLPDGLKTPR